jgi:hypothetical protein
VVAAMIREALDVIAIVGAASAAVNGLPIHDA